MGDIKYHANILADSVKVKQDDGTYKDVGSGSIKDVRVDELSVVSNEVADIDLSSYHLIKLLTDGDTAYSYQGDKVAFNKGESSANRFALKRFCDLDYVGTINTIYPQGTARYGKYLFCAYSYKDQKSTGTGLRLLQVFDLIDKKTVAKIDITPLMCHGNNLDFGSIIPDGSSFPALYISQEEYSGHCCYVIQITVSTNGVWGYSLLQTITFPQPNSTFQAYYPNTNIDRDNNCIWVQGYMYDSPRADRDTDPKNNMMCFHKFPLPDLTAGDVTYTLNNRLDYFESDMESDRQDGFISDGRLIIGVGTGDTARPCKILVYDLTGKTKISDIIITDVVDGWGLREIESVFEYKNRLFIAVTLASQAVWEAWEVMLDTTCREAYIDSQIKAIYTALGDINTALTSALGDINTALTSATETLNAINGTTEATETSGDTATDESEEIPETDESGDTDESAEIPETT